MDMLQITGLAICFLTICFIFGFNPRRSRLSSFELDYRSQMSDPDANYQISQNKFYPTIQSLRFLKVVIFAIIGLAIFIGFYNIWQSIFMTIALVILAGWLSRVGILHKYIQNIYNQLEPKIINIFTKYPFISKVFTFVADEEETENLARSRQELLHIVESSPGILSRQQQKMLVGGLELDNRMVRDYMTPRSMIEGIEADELLGPLVLDGLHKTGHSRFPVINKDLDHVVGILYIHDLLSLKTHQSISAAKAMNPIVHYINQEQNLKQALVAMIKARHHLFVVVNEYRETTGLISLEDVLESLLGAKIVDEFDKHDDLRAVASRNVGANNLPIHRHDV